MYEVCDWPNLLSRERERQRDRETERPYVYFCMETNNRMGKTRELFKKIRDTKGIFHAKMDSIKDRDGRNQTEAKYIKKRWQEYREELYKKIFTTQIIMKV